MTPEVAAVELVFPGGGRVRVSTEAGPAYKGRYAGRVRFFVAEASGRRGQEARYAKLLGSDGSTLAVVRDDFYGPVRVGRAKRIARGRVDGGRWSLRAFHKRSLAPLPGNEERFVEES